jgi:hypothetical protein
MNYVVQTGSGAIMYILSFIKFGSHIKKLMEGDTHTHRQHDDGISLLSLF